MGLESLNRKLRMPLGAAARPTRDSGYRLAEQSDAHRCSTQLCIWKQPNYDRQSKLQGTGGFESCNWTCSSEMWSSSRCCNESIHNYFAFKVGNVDFHCFAIS